MNIVDVPLSRIEIGERRRTDLGDVAALAKGMKPVGLLNPIILDRAPEKGRYRLVAGERRVRAARSLRWKTIASTLRENLTDTQLRDIEMEENENRKPLTERERWKTFAANKRVVENADKVRQLILPGGGKKDPRGQGAA